MSKELKAMAASWARSFLAAGIAVYMAGVTDPAKNVSVKKTKATVKKKTAARKPAAEAKVPTPKKKSLLKRLIRK